MKYRYELPTFAFYDYTGMICHLEKMAQRGWMLDKMGGVFWRYHAIEPQRTRFALVYFPEVTGFEPRKPEGHSRMEDLCAGTGWKLAATAGKFQVYSNDDPDPVELDTEPLTQVEVIHRAMKKSLIPSYGMLSAAAILNLITQIQTLTRDYGVQFSGPIHYFSSASWMMIPMWSAMLLLYALELGRYFLWYRKALKRAEEGLHTPSPASRWAQALAILLLVLIVFSWLGAGQLTTFVLITLSALIPVFVVARLAVAVMKRCGVSAKTNQIITVVLAATLTMVAVTGVARYTIDHRPQRDTAQSYTYQGHTFTAYSQEIPLRLEELGYPAGNDSTVADVQSTPLITRTACIQRPRMDAVERRELQYIIADVHFRPLWKSCLEDWLGDNPQPVDAKPWQAEQVWQVEGRYASDEYTYVLCWQDRLVWIDLEEVPTDEQKTIIGEKLKP